MSTQNTSTLTDEPLPELNDKGRMADIPLSPEAKITVERRGEIVLIGVNRPQVYNRFDPDAFFGLAKAYYDFDNDPSLRAAVFFGHGENFSRGIDVDAFAPLARTGKPFAITDGMLAQRAQRLHPARHHRVQGFPHRVVGTLQAASTILVKMPRLPGTFASSPISSFSTRRSARALIRWISPISSSTRPSTSSACRVQHSAASSVYRTGGGQLAKSEGYMRAARARKAATIRSEASPSTASVSPSARTIDSLPVSASSVSSPSGPGSDFSSASTFGRDSRSSSRPHTTGPSRPAAVAAKSSSNRRQPEATTRST